MVLDKVSKKSQPGCLKKPGIQCILFQIEILVANLAVFAFLRQHSNLMQLKKKFFW